MKKWLAVKKAVSQLIGPKYYPVNADLGFPGTGLFPPL